MIHKRDLIVGAAYEGDSRNADLAVWTGTEFRYMRKCYLTGESWPECLKHPEDDDGSDLFYPSCLREVVNDFNITLDGKDNG